MSRGKKTAHLSAGKLAISCAELLVQNNSVLRAGVAMRGPKLQYGKTGAAAIPYLPKNKVVVYRMHY